MDATFDELLHLVARNMTRSVFESLLKPKHLHDESGKLINSFHCALAYIKRNTPVVLVGMVIYEVCPNDCVLFTKDYSALKQCPHCGADRFDGNGDPFRLYPYVPIIPRIRRMYASEAWSRMFAGSYEQSRSQNPDGFIEDIFDGSVYKRISEEVGHSKYHIPFFFGCDGITMDAAKKNLSVEPIALVNCWVPQHNRTKSEYCLLGGLIPPGNSNVQVFLEPLLEELTTEFRVYDALTSQWHDCTPLLIFGCFDYQALSKFTCGNSKPSKFACHECHFRGVSCKHSRTTVYMGHFVFLPQEEKELREKCAAVMLPPDDPLLPAVKSTDGPPRKRSKKFTLAAGKMADEFPYDKENGRHPRRLNYQQSTPFINLSLSYWHPRNCIGYCGLHAWLNKVLLTLNLGYSLSLSLSLSLS